MGNLEGEQTEIEDYDSQSKNGRCNNSSGGVIAMASAWLSKGRVTAHNLSTQSTLNCSEYGHEYDDSSQCMKPSAHTLTEAWPLPPLP